MKRMIRILSLSPRANTAGPREPVEKARMLKLAEIQRKRRFQNRLSLRASGGVGTTLKNQTDVSA
jgi:hypothetical protein